MKYAFIARHKSEFSIARMCKVLLIERSGYYVWCNHDPSERELSNSSLDNKLKLLFETHRSRYGAPRLTAELHAQGELCSKNRVEKRMKHLGLYAKGKKKYKVTTDSNHKLSVAENILNRDFSATSPNHKWVMDISYIWTNEGWIYLAVVMDLYSRCIIGWPIEATMSRQLVCNALIMALQRRGYPGRLMFKNTIPYTPDMLSTMALLTK